MATLALQQSGRHTPNNVKGGNRGRGGRGGGGGGRLRVVGLVLRRPRTTGHHYLGQHRPRDDKTRLDQPT